MLIRACEQCNESVKDLHLSGFTCSGGPPGPTPRYSQGITLDASSALASTQNSHPLSNRSQYLQCLLQLLAGMGCGHDGADAGFALGHGRISDSSSEHPFFE